MPDSRGRESGTIAEPESDEGGSGEAETPPRRSPSMLNQHQSRSLWP